MPRPRESILRPRVPVLAIHIQHFSITPKNAKYGRHDVFIQICGKSYDPYACLFFAIPACIIRIWVLLPARMIFTGAGSPGL